MIRGIHYFITKLETKIDVIPWSRFNPCAAELLVTIFRHLKLELLTQFPASNEEKHVYIILLWEIDIYIILNYLII